MYKALQCFSSYFVCFSFFSSIGVYAGMAVGGLVFIISFVVCWCYCCRSKKSNDEQTEENPQPAMPYTPYTVGPGKQTYIHLIGAGHWLHIFVIVKERRLIFFKF